MAERTVTWTVTATWRVPIPEGMSIHWIRERVSDLQDVLPRMLDARPCLHYKIEEGDWRQHQWETAYRP